ncbi:hypothetical protein ACF1G4_33395 [Streptomyces caelestis]|uniref:hypothetical protein n=1 Tax=Streptomyces sp. NRRL F-2305 TaxID=1463840 RepID=UPI000996AC60|nr:hypothetical protein [Streptomyces sp. NRRL F-2305]
MGIAFVWVGGCVLVLVTGVTWMVRRAWRRAWDDPGMRATAHHPGAGAGRGTWPAGTGAAHGGASAHDTGNTLHQPSWWEGGASGGSPSDCADRSSSGSSASCGSGSSCGSSSSCGSGSSSCGSGSSSCGSSC